MKPNIEDKIYGSIVGGAIGDSLGIPFEGTSIQKELPNFKPMQKTSDDTQLTLATCEGIISSPNVNPEKIAQRFKVWFSEGRVTGIGSSTLKALRDLKSGAHWALAGRKGEHAAGNGAAMRIAPLAFFLDPLDFSDKIIIKDICRITHDNDEAYCGALAVLLALRLTIIDEVTSVENPLQFIGDHLFDSNVRDRIYEFSEFFPSKSIYEIGEKYGANGYVVNSVPVALYGAFKIHDFTFEDIIRQLLQIGDDSDTVCSIAGQIMGSSIGISQLNQKLIDSLPMRDFILDICHQVNERYERTTGHSE